VRQGEAKLGDKELLDVGTTDVGDLLDLGDSKNLNRTESGTVTRCHVLVTSLGGINSGQLSELFVHVVSTRARVESKPDAKVLDLERLFLVDDVECHDLTGGLLGFSKLTEVVPETGFCDHVVGRKDPHAVELGVGILFGRELASNDLIFLEPTHSCRSSEGDGWGRELLRATEAG